MKVNLVHAHTHSEENACSSMKTECKDKKKINHEDKCGSVTFVWVVFSPFLSLYL